jgi:hypothetical protein
LAAVALSKVTEVNVLFWQLKRYCFSLTADGVDWMLSELKSQSEPKSDAVARIYPDLICLCSVQSNAA